MKLFNSVAIAVAGALVTVAPATEAASAPAVQYYEVRARHSGKCLDVGSKSMNHGTDVIHGSCVGDGTSTGTNQQWSLRPVN